MVVMMVVTVSGEVGRSGAAGDARVVPGHRVAVIRPDGLLGRRMEAVHFRVNGFRVTTLSLVALLKISKQSFHSLVKPTIRLYQM